MTQYTYFLIDLFTVIICFIASFDRRIRFNRHFGAFFKAAVLAAFFYIAWDVWFTKMGVWWFNEKHTIGWSIIGLPVEEWLFFLCIPFACVFTYFCLDKFFNLNWSNRFNMLIASVTMIVCLGVAIIFYEKLYPFVTAMVGLLTMSYLFLIAKVKWIGKASFVYLVLMVGFFIVNGLLTGTGLESPVVNYNSTEILNIRMLTIPVEDAVYGYTQYLIVLYLFKRFKNEDYEG